MISHFPSPILSVAADVVKDIDGEDALCGLWALFTKCKESLKDGRRLENISWRLWYREFASAQSSPSSSPGSLSPPFSEKRSPSPITPVSDDGLVSQQGTYPLPHPCPYPPGGYSGQSYLQFITLAHLAHPSLTPSTDITTAHSWHAQNPATTLITAGRRLSTASAPMERRKSQTSVGVGKMILDILPRKVDVKAEQATRAFPMPQILQPRPVVATLPTVQLPASPPHHHGHSFPRVVVVNPTPHPTPPATPCIPHPPTVAAQPSTHLLPPPLARSLISAPITPARLGNPKAPSKATPAPHPKQPSPTSSLVSDSHDAIPTAASKQKPYNDDTLKASDRRFFLQDAGSPDVDSPERPTNKESDAPSETGEHVQGEQDHSPSSGTSSHMKSEMAGHTSAAGGGARRPRVQMRKSKERHAPVRPALQRLHSHGLRQTSQKKAVVADAKKTTFNIGSVSSNGSRSGKSNKAPDKGEKSKTRPSSPTGKAPANAKQVNVSAAAPPTANGKGGPSQQRRGIVISTSSEYETDTDDDDSEWASEDSTEDRNKDRQAKTAEEARLREAVEEAQRQRDMFAKVPKRSYSNLNRTRSGLLSQLLNPDPNIFPPNHPYRTTRSTQDMTQFVRQGNTPKLQMSKSSAAMPLAAQVNAQAPVVSPDNGRQGGGYRLKGPPQDEELEDTESDDENPDDTIQVSQSLAQQKLAALVNPNFRRHSDRGLLKEQQQLHQKQLREAVGRSPLPNVASAPIPLNHPYNLPAPPPPMTPRTTRRQMLQTELSESLRRNLLWERQVSRKPMNGRRVGVLGAGLRPLTSMDGEAQQQSQEMEGEQGQRHASNDDDREERKRSAMARNRSWADEYHYSGW